MSDAPASASRDDHGAPWPQRLRAERERRGLQRRQVADELHVDVWIIEALEAGRFSNLGAPVYARGHLRKYAELLGLNAEELTSAFERETAQPPPLVRITPAPVPRSEVSVNRLGALVVAALVIGAAWWTLAEREDGTPAVAPTPPAESAKQPATAETIQPAAVPDVTTPPMAENEPVAVAPSATEAGGVDAVPLGTPVRLRLNFSADSWVELYDAGGRRVFFDVGPANSVRSFTAAAPLRVFLGYADGVQLELNGQPVSLPAQVRQGNLARFTVDAQGQVRPEEG